MTIRQYIALLDKLMGRVREDSFMKMVQNLVSASKANYESAMEIAAALPYVKAEMMAKVLREIKEHLDKRLKARAVLSRNVSPNQVCAVRT